MKTMVCVKWLWKISKGFRQPIALQTLAGLAYVGSSLFLVYACKHLIDIATGISPDSLGVYVGWMVIGMTAQLLLSISRTRLASWTEAKMRNKMQHQLFSHLMKSRWTGRKTLHTGDILNRMETDTASVTDAVCRNMPAVMVTLAQLLGAISFLSMLNLRLAVTLLFIMPIALLLSKRYVYKMRQMTKEIRSMDSHIQSHIQEKLQHRIIIQTLEHTHQTIIRLTALQESLLRQILRRMNFSVFSRSMVQLGFMVGYVIAFLWGVFGLRDGTVTFGMMAAFLQLVAQVQRPMVDLSRQIPAFARVLTAMERLAELASMPTEPQGIPVKFQGQVGIRMEHVSFSYPDNNQRILHDFSHDFKPGSLTAIVGETGVGKSTLAKLILGLAQPTEGSISLYDGCQESKASPQTRCNLCYVPQGNTLLSGSIRDNLLIGNPKAQEEELKWALHTAAADFVFSLPHGMDTLYGEQGAGLSEGQAQRIAIARALLRPGGVLLLDEPSSSLDPSTESLLLQRLSHQMSKKTFILITHRESIAQRCSSIVRMNRL